MSDCPLSCLEDDDYGDYGDWGWGSPENHCDAGSNIRAACRGPQQPLVIKEELA